jgi:hypothetical protein
MRKALLTCLALTIVFSVQFSWGSMLSRDGKTSYVIVVAKGDKIRKAYVDRMIFIQKD